MEFGIVLQTDPPAQAVIELAQRAEAAGMGYVFTYDSCVLWQEPFVIYSQILATTSRIVVGPMVTNPATRDWSVTASLFATLNEMYGNRTICGIGRGDSALRVIGRPPTSLGSLKRSITVIKELAEGREVEHNGQAVRLPWVRNGQLPVWGAALGPRALAAVGASADGLVFGIAEPGTVRWAVDSVHRAAEEAGRDPSSLAICIAAPAYVGNDIAHQRDQLRWIGGMVGNHVAELVERYGRTSSIPRSLTDYIAERQDYDYAHHGRVSNPGVDFVPDDIVDRFCILGPAQHHIERLRDLQAAGVTHFAIQLMHDGKIETLDAYRDAVIPAFHSP